MSSDTSSAEAGSEESTWTDAPIGNHVAPHIPAIALTAVSLLIVDTDNGTEFAALATFATNNQTPLERFRNESVTEAPWNGGSMGLFVSEERAEQSHG